MKGLVLLLCLMSSFAFADTSDKRVLMIDGFESELEVNLSTEKTKTEYEYVRVPSTCYRTEYRQRCYRQQAQCRQICNNNGCRNHCSPGRMVCRTEPVSVPYSCTRTVRRSYQVHDYYVETNAKFIVNIDDNSHNASEEFTVSVKGEKATLKVKGSKNYFIVLEKENRLVDMDSGVKRIDIVYNINLVSAQKVKTAFSDGIKNVKLKKGILTFSLGEGFNLTDFNQQIRIYRYKRFASDRLLLDKNLNESEVDTQDHSGRTQMSLDLTKLGINLPSKVKVRLNSSFKIDENKLLNKGDIKLDTAVGWIFK